MVTAMNGYGESLPTASYSVVSATAPAAIAGATFPTGNNEIGGFNITLTALGAGADALDAGGCEFDEIMHIDWDYSHAKQCIAANLSYTTADETARTALGPIVSDGNDVCTTYCNISTADGGSARSVPAVLVNTQFVLTNGLAAMPGSAFLNSSTYATSGSLLW